MNEKVDTRGLSCPQPVILVNKAIQKGVFPVEVIVDSNNSCENVTRMAEKSGCRVSVEEQGREIKVTISR